MTYRHTDFFLKVQAALCKDEHFAHFCWWTQSLQEAHTPQPPILLLSSSKLEISQPTQVKEWKNFLSNCNKWFPPKVFLSQKKPLRNLTFRILKNTVFLSEIQQLERGEKMAWKRVLDRPPKTGKLLVRKLKRKKY